ncbi:hypothetical protein MRB53_038701 [Persea americana]|nr:hypothetical protein MRB53_038701 [Persea americana]
MIGTSSFNGRSGDLSTALLFPSFTYVTDIDPSSKTSVAAFRRGFLLPTTLHDRLSSLPDDITTAMRQSPADRLSFTTHPINDVYVLICGHGARDSRCGILGPILEAEFKEKLDRSRYPTISSPREGSRSKDEIASVVGQISHVGGHKYAGNVIVYIPPGADNALAGMGVWYGRVEPKHVEGIVEETVHNGRIIEELLRGVVHRRPA